MNNQLKDPSRKTTFVLRTSDKDRRARSNFQWPESGYVEAPDWRPTAECGQGLHGLLLGKGDYSHLKLGSDATWQIVEVYEDTVVNIGEKVKFPFGWVVYSGRSAGAIRFLLSEISKIVNVLMNKDAATTGYAAHAATTGYAAHAATTGESAHAATTGYAAHAATTGESAHAATTGESAHAATTGKYAIAVALGKGSMVKAGENGCVVIRWQDTDRPRISVGYVGEDIKANTWYKVDGSGYLVEVQE